MYANPTSHLYSTVVFQETKTNVLQKRYTTKVKQFYTKPSMTASPNSRV